MTDYKLPKGITVKDCKYPSYKDKDQLNWQVGQHGQLDLHYTERFGWVITTLHISNASKRQRMAGINGSRSYGITVDGGQIVSVGLGPHVKASVTVYIRNSRTAKLQKFIDLYNKGMEDANNIRDRRSTRIAQTKQRNADWW